MTAPDPPRIPAEDEAARAASASSTTGLDLAGYGAAVASGQPTPGGGSVVAVVAALGAALAEMVANLSLGRAADAVGAEPELRPALARATALRRRLLGLAAEDEAAYGRYSSAAALPRATEGEKRARRDAMQAALVGATDVPLAVAEACVELADALAPIARLGNRHVLSDAAIAAHLAVAALRGALLNLRGNARLMADAESAASYLRRADELEREGETSIRRALTALAERGA